LGGITNTKPIKSCVSLMFRGTVPEWMEKENVKVHLENQPLNRKAEIQDSSHSRVT